MSRFENLPGGISPTKGLFIPTADVHWRPAAGGSGIETYHPGDEERRALPLLPGDMDAHTNPTEQLYARRQYIARRAAWLLAARPGATTEPEPAAFADRTEVRRTPDGAGLLVVLPDGSQVWRDARWLLHRADGPAVERADGGRSWWRHGALHRTDGPAVEHGDGGREWWVEGRRHRTDGPAQELADGTRAWWADGERHRPDGPAQERSDGSREWWFRGKRHRDGGPAVEKANGTREWYRDGVLHRGDGPALELPSGRNVWYRNGVKHRAGGPAVEGPLDRWSWWLNGVNVTEDEVRRA